MTFAVGALVRARGREWVVLPESDGDLLVLRPLGGTEDEVAGIPTATAKRLLAVLKEQGILDTVSEGRGRRPALLVYPELLRVAGSRAANLVDHR